MKKITGLCASVLAVALLLSGCYLRNRRPSSEFVPATNAPRTTSTVEAAETEPHSATNAVRELTRHSIRTIVSENASFMDIYGKDWSYEFRLPFVDFPTTEASDSNIEIDRIFRQAIDEQLKKANLGQPLTVPKIDYECYYTGTLITLNVWKEKTNSEIERAVYCFRSDGTLATTTEILEATWNDPDEFLEKVRAQLKERYIAENAEDIDYVTYNTYLEKTLKGIDRVDDISVYADFDDRITAQVLIYTARGVASHIELPINP